MSNIAIKAENLSKAYQLGQIGTGTISRDFERWLARLRGKEDPFLKIGERNDQNTKSESNIVWSLQDINFEIEQGEAVGIIGKNGAGKSTLLKILSKVTAPTTGSVSGKGRIASLLEVGTGFHPELSGRENIFLNGAILGMRKKEIKRKLEEIVDFAGVEKYLDTPVKRYSSGMYVRLAFAVAAHLESEILIIDEVLAVGDAEFQKKCLGKMGEVSKGEGRTVLFVSHNMGSIQKLCRSSLLLQNGMLAAYDNTSKIIKTYSEFEVKPKISSKWAEADAPGSSAVKILEVYVDNTDGSEIQSGQFSITKDIAITVLYKVLQQGVVFTHGANFYNNEGINIFNSHDVSSDFQTRKRDIGIYEATMWIPGNLLSEGIVKVSIALFQATPFKLFAFLEEEIVFNIFDDIKGDSARGNYTNDFPGIVRPLLKWAVKQAKYVK